MIRLIIEIRDVVEGDASKIYVTRVVDAPQVEQLLRIQGVNDPSNYRGVAVVGAEVVNDLEVGSPRVPIDRCRYDLQVERGRVAREYLAACGIESLEFAAHLIRFQGWLAERCREALS